MKRKLHVRCGVRGKAGDNFKGLPIPITANQRNMKALKYSYRDRRRRKREIRSLWISRINNATRNYNLNYNGFIHKLKKLNISINRKWLSQLAIRDPQVFYELIQVRTNA